MSNATKYTFKGRGIRVTTGEVVMDVDELTVVIPDTVNVQAGAVDVPKPYISEIAQVLLYGAPQYARGEDGKLRDVHTGVVFDETQAELEANYPSVTALINDIAAKAYNRIVKLFGVQGYADGEVLPISQFGIDPPAGFRGNPNGDGTLVQMQVNPAATPTVTIPPVTTGLRSAVVFEASKGDKNGRTSLPGLAGTPYVAHLTAKGMKDGYGHLSLSEVPGAATVARTRELALDGKIVEARGLPSVSSDVTFAVKAERFVSVNDVPRDAGVIEASWIGDQSAPFFVEYHAPA